MLTTVGDIKEHPEKTFAGVDAGFNTLIRPAFYGSYHHVVVANRFGARPTHNYDIVGPICESGDFIARDRMLPMIQMGDLIAVYDAGAYGFTMASNYNSRPLPAEVLVKDGQMNLIREAQTLDDLTAHQKIPSRLMV